jgi:hypothetical protein
MAKGRLDADIFCDTFSRARRICRAAQRHLLFFSAAQTSGVAGADRLSEALQRASGFLGEGGAVESGGVDVAGIVVPVRLNTLPM